MSIQSIRAVIVVVTMVGLAVGIGCERGSDTPTAAHAPSKNIEQPAPVLDDPFFEDVWETVYVTPFSVVTGNVSWTFVSQEVAAPGTYTGVNNSGEPFTLDVQDVDYYDAATLSSWDPPNAAVYSAHNVAVAVVYGTYSGPAGSLVLRGCVRSHDYDGVRYHYYFPFAYDGQNTLVGSLSSAKRVGGVELLEKRAETSECTGSWMNCDENSERPSKPSFECPRGKTMDSGCEEDCDEEFEGDIDRAIEDGCKRLCQAAEALDTALDGCDLGGGLGAGAAIVGTFAVSNPIGLVALVVGDLALAGGYRLCVDGAWDAYNTSVGQAQTAYQEDVDQANSDYESCASDCCVDELIPVEEIYEIIGEG